MHEIVRLTCCNILVAVCDNEPAIVVTVPDVSQQSRSTD